MSAPVESSIPADALHRDVARALLRSNLICSVLRALGPWTGCGGVVRRGSIRTHLPRALNGRSALADGCGTRPEDVPEARGVFTDDPDEGAVRQRGIRTSNISDSVCHRSCLAERFV